MQPISFWQGETMVKIGVHGMPWLERVRRPRRWPCRYVSCMSLHQPEHKGCSHLHRPARTVEDAVEFSYEAYRDIQAVIEAGHHGD